MSRLRNVVLNHERAADNRLIDVVNMTDLQKVAASFLDGDPDYLLMDQVAILREAEREAGPDSLFINEKIKRLQKLIMYLEMQDKLIRDEIAHLRRRCGDAPDGHNYQDYHGDSGYVGSACSRCGHWRKPS